MSKHDVFLKVLAADIQPVNRGGMVKGYVLWSLMVGVIGAVMTWLITRPDLLAEFGRLEFVLQFILWLSVTIVAGTSAFVLATPRWPIANGIKIAMLGLFAGVAAFGIWLAMRADSHMFEHGAVDIICILTVSGMAVSASACMSVVLERRARSTYPLAMAFMMAMAGAGAGMLVVMLTCWHEAVGHVVISHFLPAVVFGFVLTLLGRRWWRW